MRTIGLIGGMSWESSIEYERIINEAVRARLGGVHSASLITYSFDFHDIEILQRSGDWAEAGRRLAGAAVALEGAGAGCVVLATNTMHRVADAIEDAVSIPLLHIADATAAAIHRDGVNRVGLLGTAYTMEEEFYRGRLESVHGLDVLIPDADDRATVHDVIFDELVVGVIDEGSRATYEHIIERMVGRGAGGIILGCTEIELLVRPESVPYKVYPTTYLHAMAAVDWALEAT